MHRPAVQDDATSRKIKQLFYLIGEQGREGCTPGELSTASSLTAGLWLPKAQLNCGAMQVLHLRPVQRGGDRAQCHYTQAAPCNFGDLTEYLIQASLQHLGSPPAGAAALGRPSHIRRCLVLGQAASASRQRMEACRGITHR